jgi:sugar fermentation stimulation protein A
MRRVRFDSPPLAGRLVRRYKRFFADVRLASGEVVTAHCPNTGSLLGCLDAGNPVWLRDSGNAARKLRFTWQAVRVGRAWVNVDTLLPNRVVADALARERVPELAGYPERRREVRCGKSSRIDLLLDGKDGRPCFVEIKSTTLVDGKVALFPDARTERGVKHLAALARAARRGERAVQFFFVNRADVELFRPADAIDPEYGRALRRAVAAGVEVLAWTARVGARSLELGRSLPIDLGKSVARPRSRARRSLPAATG